ncbi:MAG: phospholipase D-like domain-containing protein [Bacillota bacterium]
MRYRFYTTSNKAWDGIFKAIDSAKSSVFIEMYIFLGDTGATHDFLGKLAEKARSGVKVIVIADAYGSLQLKSSAVTALKEAGAEFRYFSHWLKRLHRKLVIVDEETAFLGGVNIEDKIRYWNDLQVRLSGPVIRPLLRSFANTYVRCGGKDSEVLKYRRDRFIRKIKSWILDDWQSEYNIKRYYLDKINQSLERIRIVTPYLLPPRRLMVALDEAVRRGVSVEIIIPEDTDIKSLNRLNLVNACRLAACGVNFYYTQKMNHAKVMEIDGREALVGSQNLDFLSFGPNLELGVFLKQKEAVASVGKIIDRWQGEAYSPDLSPRSVGLWTRVLMYLYRIFFPFF